MKSKLVVIVSASWSGSETREGSLLDSETPFLDRTLNILSQRFSSGLGWPVWISITRSFGLPGMVIWVQNNVNTSVLMVADSLDAKYS